MCSNTHLPLLWDECVFSLPTQFTHTYPMWAHTGMFAGMFPIKKQGNEIIVEKMKPQNMFYYHVRNMRLREVD